MFLLNYFVLIQIWPYFNWKPCLWYSGSVWSIQFFLFFFLFAYFCSWLSFCTCVWVYVISYCKSSTQEFNAFAMLPFDATVRPCMSFTCTISIVKPCCQQGIPQLNLIRCCDYNTCMWIVYSYSVKHLHVKVVFVWTVCAHRFSCVLVSLPLVLCTASCIHVDLTYWIVYRLLMYIGVAS